VLVPVAVRVEAGWDRSSRDAALLNRISRAQDSMLDGRAANRAAAIRRNAGVSVVDATVAAAAERAARPVAILTSDAADLRRLAGLVENDVRVVRL
jgi:predicted nucleic acid-binding protein